MLSPAIVDVFILPYEVILALWIVTNILQNFFSNFGNFVLQYS